MGIAYTPRDWSSGEFVTDAMMDTEIRDPFTGLMADWDGSWNPGSASNWIAATTNPAIGNGTSLGAFRQIGKTIEFQGRILPGSTTTFGSGTYTVNLPIAPISSTLNLGTAVLIIAGTRYIGVCLANANGFAIAFHGAGSSWTPTVPATFANGSSVHFSGAYRIT